MSLSRKVTTTGRTVPAMLYGISFMYNVASRTVIRQARRPRRITRSYPGRAESHRQSDWRPGRPTEWAWPVRGRHLTNLRLVGARGFVRLEMYNAKPLLRRSSDRPCRGRGQIMVEVERPVRGEKGSGKRWARRVNIMPSNVRSLPLSRSGLWIGTSTCDARPFHIDY